MSFITARTLASILLVASVVAPPYARAQVTIDLSTTQQTNCTVTTDAQGLQLAPGGSTNLQAAGVTLSGTGCGGAPVSNFQAQVSVPATAVGGTPFNVQWSASAIATQCTFSGNSNATWTGVTGWPIGASACSGSCGGSHLASVTVPSAGTYSFGVTCTNSTGVSSAATTSSAPPSPPQPNNFPLTIAPATPTTGTPFQVTWAVTGATACSGSASFNGNSVTLPGWTDKVDASSPRTINPTSAGTYGLSLTCTNAAPGQATSQNASVLVNPVGGAGDNCPTGRQLTGDLCYNYNLAPGNCVAGADLTTFSSIWGRSNAVATPVAFPGAQYFTIFKNMAASQYVAAKFTVPTTGLPSNQIGFFTHGETLPGPNLTMAISSTCGDFNPSPSICLRTDINAGGLLTKWQLPGANGVACPLVPGQTYFINLKMTRPTDCQGPSCTVTVQHNHTP